MVLDSVARSRKAIGAVLADPHVSAPISAKRTGSGRSGRQRRRRGDRGMMDTPSRCASRYLSEVVAPQRPGTCGEIALREKDFGSGAIHLDDYQSGCAISRLGLVELGLAAATSSASSRQPPAGCQPRNRRPRHRRHVTTFIATCSMRKPPISQLWRGQTGIRRGRRAGRQLLTLADRAPHLKHIVIPITGMRKYDDPGMMEADKLASLGRERAARSRISTTGWWTPLRRGRCDPLHHSGTTPTRNLAMLAAGRVLRHCATYLAFDPKGPDDEYVSVLPLPGSWNRSNVLGKGLLCRMKINSSNSPTP